MTNFRLHSMHWHYKSSQRLQMFGKNWIFKVFGNVILKVLEWSNILIFQILLRELISILLLYCLPYESCLLFVLRGLILVFLR